MAALEANGLARFISLVVGYEEVGFERQKPAPDGLLVCIERLGIRPGTVFYVGDHDTDVLCAERANRALMASGAGMKIVSIRAAFGDAEPGSWGHEPDFVAERPEEVVEIVSGSEEARR
jgi:phosphoglycolate phosphatase-like HAD superfamily hydrolase